MRYALTVFILIISVPQIFSQVKDISYSYQYFLTYESAQKDDYVGKFFSCFTYDTIDAITFSKVSGNNAFDVEYLSGMIFIKDPGFLKPGKDTIAIEVCDSGFCRTYQAIISVIDKDSCVFIDPTVATNGNGTFQSPYNSWKNISPGTFKAGYAYMQKRGTTEKTSAVGPVIAIRHSKGTFEKHISIGSYGVGNKPIIINERSEETGITMGNYRGEGARYVDVYGFEFRACRGILVHLSQYNEHLMFTDITTSGCPIGNGNIYIMWVEPDKYFNMDISFYNIISYHPLQSHCIKSDRDVDFTNVLVYGAVKHGLSMVGAHNNARYVLAHHNGDFGIEIQNDSCTVVKCVVHDNEDGIMFVEDVWTNNKVDSCYSFNNRDDGIEVRSKGYSVITNSFVFGNKGTEFDDYLGDGICIRKEVDSALISRNKIYDNVGIGIRTYNQSGSGIKNVKLTQNIIYNNSKAISIENGEKIYVYNNTCFEGGIYETTTGYTEAKNNILGNISGYWKSSNNLFIQSDSIFVDAANNNFHLNENATNAINQGLDIGFTTDYDGNAIVNSTDDKPDIGAFEFQYVTGTKPIEYDDEYNRWNIFPNPFSNVINIENKNGIGQIEIYNMLGSMIESINNHGSTKKQLRLDAFKDGIYLLKLKDPFEKASFKKIIKTN